MGSCFACITRPSDNISPDVELANMPQTAIDQFPMVPTDLIKGHSFMCRWVNVETSRKKGIYDGDTAYAVFVHPATGQLAGENIRFLGYDAAEMRQPALPKKTKIEIKRMGIDAYADYMEKKYTRYARKEFAKYHRECLQKALIDDSKITVMSVIKRDKYGRPLAEVYVIDKKIVDPKLDMKDLERHMTNDNAISTYMLSKGCYPYMGGTKFKFTVKMAEKHCKLMTRNKFHSSNL